MKTLYLILLLSCATALAIPPVKSVMTDSNGVVSLPANFWAINSNGVNSVIGSAGVTSNQLASSTNLTMQSVTNQFVGTNAVKSAAYHLASDFLTPNGDGSGLSQVTAVGVTAPFNISDVPVTASAGLLDFSAFAVGLKAISFQGDGHLITGLTNGLIAGDRATNSFQLKGALTNGDSRSVTFSNDVAIYSDLSVLGDISLQSGGALNASSGGIDSIGPVSLHNTLSVDGSITGNGSSLTNLNGSTILSGTISAARIGDLSGTYEAHSATLTNLVRASNVISGGTLASSVMPALTGDATTSAGAVAVTLKNTGSAGTYRSVTFDAQGRETSGSNPTTFSGYGLSDTSANLASALTDETGTGLAVFSISPTFTGIISSDKVVATNYTGNGTGLTNTPMWFFGGNINLNVTVTTNYAQITGSGASTSQSGATNFAVPLARDLYLGFMTYHRQTANASGTNEVFHLLTNGIVAAKLVLTGNGSTFSASTTFSPPIYIPAGSLIATAFCTIGSGSAGSTAITFSFGQ